MSGLACSIRTAERGDLPGIVDIYNEAIKTTTATFDVEPKTLAEREGWFLTHTEKWPIIVASGDGSVLGWASLSRWSGRCAYAGTAELSFYVGERPPGPGDRQPTSGGDHPAGERRRAAHPPCHRRGRERGEHPRRWGSRTPATSGRWAISSDASWMSTYFS